MMGYQGRRKAPTALARPPPTPTDGFHPCLAMTKGGRATGTGGGTVGVGGMGDVGRGQGYDPGSPSSPYLSGIARKGRDGASPSSTHLK